MNLPQFTIGLKRRILYPALAALIFTTVSIKAEETARDVTKSKLVEIRFEDVSFENLPLNKVLAQLTADSQRLDPEKVGVKFLIATNDPILTNVPNIFISHLVDIRLIDALNAIRLVSDQKIHYQVQNDGEVVFSGVQKTPQLYSRVFIMDLDEIEKTIKQKISEEDWKAVVSTNSLQTLRNYFSRAGVNFNEPPGKSIFYNDRLTRLFVKATESDLDLIGNDFKELFQGLPAIHLKSHFIDVPKGTVAGLEEFFIATNTIEKVFTGILFGTNNQAVVHSLESLPGVEWLAEPEATIHSGQRIGLRATSLQNLDPNYGRNIQISGPASFGPEPDCVETGPSLDLAPHVLTDGSTINLAGILSVRELVEIVASTNAPPDSTNAGVRPDKLKFTAKTRDWQVAVNVNLWDGQTVFVGGLPVVTMASSGKADKSKIDARRELLVFITPTIVDTAGLRVHKDKDLPLAQREIPPQERTDH